MAVNTKFNTTLGTPANMPSYLDAVEYERHLANAAPQ